MVNEGSHGARMAHHATEVEQLLRGMGFVPLTGVFLCRAGTLRGASCTGKGEGNIPWNLRLPM